MGALFKGVCYESQGQALDAFYGSAPVDELAGSTVYFGYWERISEGVWSWVVSKKVTTTGVVTETSTLAPVVNFPVCDPMAGFNDGQALGWAFAVVLFLAWGVGYDQEANSMMGFSEQVWVVIGFAVVVVPMLLLTGRM